MKILKKFFSLQSHVYGDARRAEAEQQDDHIDDAGSVPRGPENKRRISEAHFLSR